jgi:hypothetical protein
LDYRQFYFQTQHPYVYSSRSVARLLEQNGFQVNHFIPHQRYGLENHMTWLSEHRPGGNETLRALFEPTDASYRAQLEDAGKAATPEGGGTPGQAAKGPEGKMGRPDRPSVQKRTAIAGGVL